MRGAGSSPRALPQRYDLSHPATQVVARGRKVAMADPDMGNWTYAYNALGELVGRKSCPGDVGA